MKKFFLTIVFFLFLCNAFSQGITLPQKPTNRTVYKDYSLTESGYWCAIESMAGATAMFNRKNIPFLGATLINGYRMNEFIRFGIGIGAKHYINNGKMRSSSIPWSFPIFADARGNIISQQDRSAVPYWSVDFGWEIRGGIFFSPTIGYRVGQSRHSLLVGLSYQLMQANTWKKDKECLNSAVLRLGYEF